jgi:hypothetical protein
MEDVMSVEFAFEGIDGLDDFMTEWADAQEICEELDIEVNEDQTWATVFVPGASIRGFSVDNGDKPEVRINNNASRTDWRLVYSFLRFLVERGATLEIEASELTDEAAVARGTKDLQNGVALGRYMLYERGNEYIGLPIRGFSIDVTRADIPASGDVDVDAFERTLTARAERYARARVPSVFRIEQRIDAVVWSGEALLTRQVDYVILGDHDSLLVPWKAFVEAHPVETIRGKEPRYYVPALDDTSAFRALGKPIKELSLPK